MNVVGSTGDATPDDPTKSKSNAGAVVQRCFKLTQLTPIKPTMANSKTPVQLSRETAKRNILSTGSTDARKHAYAGRTIKAAHSISNAG